MSTATFTLQAASRTSTATRALIRPRSLAPSTSAFTCRHGRRFSSSPPSRATHYDALGLHPGAHKREVKTAFYKLSKELHPDRNPEADEAAKAKYLAASEAYAILGDDRRRRAYDRTLESTSSTTPRSPLHHHTPDLTRRARATHAWEHARRPRPAPNYNPHRPQQPTADKHYHYPGPARRNDNRTGRVYTEWEKNMAAEDRVRKDSGLVRTLQVFGLITAVSAFAGSLGGL